MSERDLWAAVAEAAITDHARRIALARAGARRIANDTNGGYLSLYSVQTEIDEARAYFSSADWREVADLAGVNIGCEAIMAVLTDGVRSHRIAHRVAGPRTGPTIQQGAA